MKKYRRRLHVSDEVDIFANEGVYLLMLQKERKILKHIAESDSFLKTSTGVLTGWLTKWSYQLIRVHASSLGENCKWLEMFEDIDLVIYCVSLTDYGEYYEDMSGIRTNKMVATKNHFEAIVTHPTHADKNFLLILNKFDLLEEKMKQVPLRNCEWFQDFNPVISLHPHSTTSNNNPSLPQRAFHYIATKFKRLFNSLSGKKLFVSRVTGLEPDSVDNALRYSKEILKWQGEINKFVGGSEWSSESMEPNSSM
ncbi:extra-large guanine nucleotide-binding protein 2-like [Primulina eburnea]|uniref:extra-large guanine nucleotide-binding protein 2-like n=1 Tax=Primulina eburnea TaxID=1245227 RepID=UPI003C6C14FE